MAKPGKRTRAILESVEADKAYTITEAVALVKSNAKAKFDETVEIAVNLGVDPKYADQMVRGVVNLPSGTGKDVRVAVFTQGANAEAAKEAGADAVGMDDLAEAMKGGEMNYDVVIASPDAMRVVGALGPVLGPRGLMPNPKTGTVTPDVATAVKNAKSGQARYRTDKAGIIHCAIGSVKFDNAALTENLKALMRDLRKAKPSASKGVYFKKVTLSTTMGPGVAIDHSGLSD